MFLFRFGQGDYLKNFPQLRNKTIRHQKFIRMIQVIECKSFEVVEYNIEAIRTESSRGFAIRYGSFNLLRG